MRETTDLSHLLSGVAQQDMEAFRALYDRTSPALMAVTLRICR